MTKIVATMVMGIVITTSAQANNVYSNTNRIWFNNTALSKVKIGGGVDNSNLYIGIDWMTPSQKGFSIGLGTDYLNYAGPKNSSQTYGSIYTFGAELKVAYDIGELSAGYFPVQLKAGYGYGVARINTLNKWGTNYSVAAEVNVYKGMGIGIAHHWQDTDMINFDDTVVYFSIAY
ncbi:hypothetical protein [Sulfurimonas sp. NWX367]|uniref:hypothetical protein n=1 Tax=Sulfurimonas sp. NWX367 TaxID=2925413 RepID=UPI003204A5B6